MIALKDALMVGCRMCNTVHTIPIISEQVERWQDGEPIHNVCPELTPDQRELLRSQTCVECWQKLFFPEDFD